MKPKIIPIKKTINGKSLSKSNSGKAINSFLENANSKQKALPLGFHQMLIESENCYNINPTWESCEILLFFYKLAVEYYGKVNPKSEKVIVQKMQELLATQTAMKLLVAKAKNKTNGRNDNDKSKSTQNINKIVNSRLKLVIQKSIRGKEDHKNKVDEIIKKVNDDKARFDKLMTSNEQVQKKTFLNKIKLRTLHSRILDVDDNDDENINTNNNNNMLPATTKNRHRRNISNISFGQKKPFRQRQVNNSIYMKGLKRRIDSFGDELLPNNAVNNLRSSIEQADFMKKVMIIPEKKKGKPNLDYKARKDTFVILLDFLNDYNRKWFFLFNSQWSSSISKMNKLLDDSYRKKISRFLEYQDSAKDFLLVMTWDSGLGSTVGSIVQSLQKEFISDTIDLQKEEDEKCSMLRKKYKHVRLKDHVAIGNLTIEALGQVAEIFK